MAEPTYKPRLADRILRTCLENFGAVCIEGPKGCGKTRTATEVAASSIDLADPAGGFHNRTLAQLSPDLVLEGRAPRLVDEWQEHPPILDAVRQRVGAHDEKGAFILTASAALNQQDNPLNDSGPIGRLRMRPMSLWESGDSDGTVSLEALCKGDLEPVLTGEADLLRLIDLIVRGGWPGTLELDASQTQHLLRERIKTIIDDSARLDGIKRDVGKLVRVLRSLARLEARTAGPSAILRDVSEAEHVNPARPTLTEYLALFDRLFLTDNQPAFSPSVQPPVRLKQAVKRHLSDPSLAAAILKMGPNELLHDMRTLGCLFESLCERDLRIYAQAFGGELFHYQDYRNQEIDAVISLPNGSWAAFEIELGAAQIDTAAKKLIRIQASLRTDTLNSAPAVLCVLCGMTNAAYRRPDGVFVVPVTALRP